MISLRWLEGVSRFCTRSALVQNAILNGEVIFLDNHLRRGLISLLRTYIVVNCRSAHKALPLIGYGEPWWKSKARPNATAGTSRVGNTSKAWMTGCSSDRSYTNTYFSSVRNVSLKHHEQRLRHLSQPFAIPIRHTSFKKPYCLRS